MDNNMRNKKSLEYQEDSEPEAHQIPVRKSRNGRTLQYNPKSEKQIQQIMQYDDIFRRMINKHLHSHSFKDDILQDFYIKIINTAKLPEDDLEVLKFCKTALKYMIIDSKKLKKYSTIEGFNCILNSKDMSKMDKILNQVEKIDSNSDYFEDSFQDSSYQSFNPNYFSLSLSADSEENSELELETESSFNTFDDTLELGLMNDGVFDDSSNSFNSSYAVDFPDFSGDYVEDFASEYFSIDNGSNDVLTNDVLTNDIISHNIISHDIISEENLFDNTYVFDNTTNLANNLSNNSTSLTDTKISPQSINTTTSQDIGESALNLIYVDGRYINKETVSEIDLKLCEEYFERNVDDCILNEFLAMSDFEKRIVLYNVVLGFNRLEIGKMFNIMSYNVKAILHRFRKNCKDSMYPDK